MLIEKIVDDLISEAVLGGTKGTRDYKPGSEEDLMWQKVAPHLGKGGRSKRKCLKCQEPFASNHVGQRVCVDCKDAQSKLGKKAGERYSVATDSEPQDESKTIKK